MLFAAGSAAALGALGWVTAEAVRLERETVRARAEAAFEERVRLALWRMDSYLAPILAEESSRPHFHYSPFYPAEDAYTRYWNEILPGEVLVPSPLLTYRAPHVKLHFELTPEGKLRSPRAPEGNMRDNAEANDYLGTDEITRNNVALRELGGMVPAEELRRRAAAERLTQIIAERRTQTVAPPPAVASASRRQMAQSYQEYSARILSNVGQVERQRKNPNLPVRSAAAPAVSQGGFVPLWIGPRRDNLVLVRRAERGKKRYVQGVWLDWPHLRGELLSLVRDLFPSAELRPGSLGDRPLDSPAPDLSGPRERGLGGKSVGTFPELELTRTLASIPTVLEPGRPEPIPLSGAFLTPTRVALAAAWAALGGAILAAGLSLRSANDLSDRRARFVSTVTHELRTPLTTFRLYTDMLESGMVTGASAEEYLGTLKKESERLSLLVENVLAYSRLEEGRAARERKALVAGELLEGASARSRERAEACGMKLAVEIAPEARDAQVLVDEATVEQIIFNLVDNACKHAAPEEPAPGAVGRPTTPGPLAARADTCPGTGSSGEATAAGGDEDRWAIRIGVSLAGRSLARRSGSSWRSRPYLAIRVRDRGSGIPPSERRGLFEPFARLAGTTVPGVGLGLALSRNLARAAGGELTCEDPGAEGGAEFVLTLPLASRADPRTS